MTENAQVLTISKDGDVARNRIEVPIADWVPVDDDGVTRHNEESAERSPAAIRKEEQRKREKAVGVVELRLMIGPLERAMLAEGQKARGSQGEPYTATEYLLTLLRNDNRLLKKQTEKLEGRICRNCQKPMPRGCGGVWGGETRCLLARSEIALEL